MEYMELARRSIPAAACTFARIHSADSSKDNRKGGKRGWNGFTAAEYAYGVSGVRTLILGEYTACVCILRGHVFVLQST